jgi:hypothetical protein
MIDPRLTNPTFIAGKLAYWQEVPHDAINHCAPDIAAAWLDGWREAKSEHMLVRSRIAGDRRRVSSVDGCVVVQ